MLVVLDEGRQVVDADVDHNWISRTGFVNESESFSRFFLSTHSGFKMIIFSEKENKYFFD